MGHQANEIQGPDLTRGVPLADVSDDAPLFGKVDGAPVYLVRVDGDVRAFGAKCTHYGAPLSTGLVADGTVRCPWHHACFSLADGSIRGGPAFNPLPPYRVRIEDGTVFVGEKEARDPLDASGAAGVRTPPGPVVIIGAGPAGTTCAETLRREGYAGSIVLIDPDPDAPYDRPNLSKDYLAGDAPEAWLPLRSAEFFEDHGIRRIVDRVTGIDPDQRRVTLGAGDPESYGALLLATGATPRRLTVPGADRAHVHELRSLADCRGIIESAETAGAAVVIGASFIGMEVAASLRARELDVTVVAPESLPFERTLGPELGRFIMGVHQDHGVDFRLGRTVDRIEDARIVLDDGSEVGCGLVVMGVGVVPSTSLAEAAGLAVDGGVVVDRFLRTSDPSIFAAGDLARYPGPSGQLVRIEHWVVAGRLGRAAARNILGLDEPYLDVPFFWSVHFDQTINYVGHAARWDQIQTDGDCDRGGCSVAFVENGARTALATVGRDDESLRAERAMGEAARGTIGGSPVNEGRQEM